jgi:hypothetical protein
MGMVSHFHTLTFIEQVFKEGFVFMEHHQDGLFVFIQIRCHSFIQFLRFYNLKF